MNIFSQEAYYTAIRNIHNEVAPVIKEYEELMVSHQELNGKLERLFKNVERLGKLSRGKALYYCVIRTKNDVINSKLKILSTKTNDANIKIQNVHGAFLQKAKEAMIIYDGLRKPMGRLDFHLEWSKNA